MMVPGGQTYLDSSLGHSGLSRSEYAIMAVMAVVGVGLISGRWYLG